MDVLSDALCVVRLTGAAFFTARMSSPWAVGSPPAGDLARFLCLESDCLALFHIVAEGSCWVTLSDHEPLRLEAGDLAIFPRGDHHVMANPCGVPPRPLSAILPALPDSGLAAVRDGGTGPVARFLCGYLHCDQRFNPLIGALPALLVLRSGATGSAPRTQPGVRSRTAAPLPNGDGSSVIPVPPDDWLAATLRHTIAEAEGQAPGSPAMLARLAEMLFVEALRCYMWQLPPAQTGWLAAVRDPVVGHALRQMHAHPDRPWTVDDLARAGAVARSTLAQRFVELTGEPPMRYLTAWRMQLAASLLRHSQRGVAQVARSVGYDSEAAFNRAFKRHTGQPPAAWRESRSA